MTTAFKPVTAKRYLLRIRALDRKINQLIEERDDLRALALGGRSPSYDPDKVQTSHDGAAMAAVERWLDLERDIVRLIDKYVTDKHRIILEIQELPDDRHVQLLNLRYVQMRRFEEISVIMGYSYSRVRHMHGDALMSFARVHGLARPKVDTK